MKTVKAIFASDSRKTFKAPIELELEYPKLNKDPSKFQYRLSKQVGIFGLGTKIWHFEFDYSNLQKTY